MRKKNQSQISHMWVLKSKAEKQTNERTLWHLSENVHPQKNLYRFFSFYFLYRTFWSICPKIFSWKRFQALIFFLENSLNQGYARLYTWFEYFFTTFHFVREFVREGLILSENLSENFSSKIPLGQKSALKPAWLSAFINSISKFRTFSDKMKIVHFLKTHENKQPRALDTFSESQIKRTFFGQKFYTPFIHLNPQSTSWIFHKEFCPRNLFSDKIGRFSDIFGQNFVRKSLF